MPTATAPTSRLALMALLCVSLPAVSARAAPGPAVRRGGGPRTPPFPGVQRPLLMAHAGAQAHAPENTLPAFALALEQGANVLEMDVHLTADGQVVVVHDATVERTTSGRGAVRELTYAALSQLDAGAHFVARDGSRPYAGRGVGVPTLDEVVAAFPGVALNIELKADGERLAPRVLEILAAGRPGPVLLAAGDDAVQRALRALDPPHALGLSEREGAAVAAAYFGHWTTWAAAAAALPPFFGDPLGAWRGVAIPPQWRGHALQPPLHHPKVPGGRVPTPGFIRALHNAGLEMHVWTVNDPEEARALLLAGVDGIFTDDPLALAPAFQVFWGDPGPPS